MKLGVNPEQLSHEQLIELVNQLIAQVEALLTANAKLKAELEQLKRDKARAAAPFSKNKRKKNPKRPGRKPGQGIFRHRTAPSEADYSGPPVEVPVEEIACPKCGGEWGEETEEIVTVTEIPPQPKPEVKAYRIKSRACGNCFHKVRGRHPRGGGAINARATARASRRSRTSVASNPASQRRPHGLQIAGGAGDDHRIAGDEERCYTGNAPAGNRRRSRGAGISALATSRAFAGNDQF
jgi:hypothetical protein